MSEQSRRTFLKQCGVGMGAVMASGLWANGMLTGCSPQDGDAFFENIFQISREEMKKLLLIALSKGGEFSELYFEYSINNSVRMEEDIIKSSSESISLGVGVRVINGEQTGYGYTNDLTFEKIKHAALTAAAIANSNAKEKIADLNVISPKLQTYDMKNSFSEKHLEDKIKIVKEAYLGAKDHDTKIAKVTASLADEIQYVTIANSDGLLISDVRPQVRLMVSATANDNGNLSTAFANNGGRVGTDFYKTKDTPTEIGKRAAKEALILLEADDAPAGEMPVVLHKDQSGVMIHEAVGHPLEADGVWKETTIMKDKLNQMVANPLVTIYDDATIPDYRGSLNIDDEGIQTKNVPLIEKGKLVGFLNDKLSAKILGHKENGHGRRQSYAHPPIPRMNNTVLESGDSDPEEIIQSVDKGFYAVSYQGGQVNGTGTFTFSVNLGYLIENGKITKPLKNATLIGSNIQIMNNVDMIGNDMGFFLGTCGKEGQSVPVTCGTPTIRISSMTVGGKA
jgi:TldD protein